MASSFRKNVVRALLNNLIKPMARPETSLNLQRVMLDRAALTMRKPRGLKYEVVTLGGIPARKLMPTKALPAHHVLYLHGGAYISGSSKSHTSLAGQVAAAACATTWLLDYRLAPEHPYPAAQDDAVAAYRALLDSGIDAKHITIAGDSAGGGLTLATTLAIRDAQLPLPAALVLLSPWTDLTLSGASMRNRLAAEPMLNPEWLDWAAGLYCGAESEGKSTLRTDPGVSPLFANFSAFPPMLIQVGSDEILLDDATFLATSARQAGVDVTLHEYEGLWHVFQAQAGIIGEADEAIAEIGAFIQRNLKT